MKKRTQIKKKNSIEFLRSRLNLYSDRVQGNGTTLIGELKRTNKPINIFVFVSTFRGKKYL